MSREKTRKITTRLNYRHETKAGLQLLFEIRNYTANAFRINVYDIKGKIIHLKKDNVVKDRIVNYPRETVLNNYLDVLKEKCKRTLEFLGTTNIEITKKNVEKYLYKNYSDVISYYEFNIEDDEDAALFFGNLNKTPDDYKKEQENERKRLIELGMYEPQLILEILKHHNPPRYGTKLHSIISFYLKMKGISDIHYSLYNKKLLDDIIKHCIDNGYQANSSGKIERYRYTTIFNITKMLKKFGKFLTLDLGLQINQDYKDFNVTTGTENSHIKYKWNDKNNIFTLYHDEFKKIENADFSKVKDKNTRERYELAQLMFMVQTYAGGLRISELYEIKKDSFEEINGEMRLLIMSKKTRKPINTPVSDKLLVILKKNKFNLPRFDFEQDYNDALKEIALYLGLDREILIYDDYAHVDSPKHKKRKLYALFSSKLARKALVSILYNQGEKIEYISRITNHSKTTIEYYIELEDKHKKKMLDGI